MPIKPVLNTLRIGKYAIVKVYVYTGDVYDGNEPIEFILDKLEAIRDTDRARELEPLYYMIEKIIYGGLNDTRIDFKDESTTFYVYYEDSSDFDEIEHKIKNDEEFKKCCSIHYHLIEKLWFPYSIELEVLENLYSLRTKIRKLQLGPKTSLFYKNMIPIEYVREKDIDLSEVKMEDNYLVLTIQGYSTRAIDAYEEYLKEKYNEIKNRGLVD